MEQLGIQPSLLLAQIVNFSIIVFVLAKLLYKPILTMLDKRRKEIEEGLKLTEKMREEEEGLKAKREKVLDTARKEGRALLEQVKKDAKEQERQIIEDAHKEAQGLLDKAQEEARKQYDEMLSKVRKEAVELAVSMTQRLTADVLTGKDQHDFIAKQAKKLETLKV